MNLKEKKNILFDLDGVMYGSHNGYPLDQVFGMISRRMTLFIQQKLKGKFYFFKQLLLPADTSYIYDLKFK